MSLHENYGQNLEVGTEFQDFVADTLHEEAGLVVHNYRSRKYQVNKGENRIRLEVKLDRKWHKTGQLFIETEERWNTEVPMRPAGINANNWLYAIGDNQKFWVFATSTLRNLEAQCARKETPTARGFVLPINLADRWAAYIFDEGSLAEVPQNLPAQPTKPEQTSMFETWDEAGRSRCSPPPPVGD